MHEMEEDCTKDIAKSILPIDKETVHNICSGQVVVSLAVAVKELIENSLDAGSTIIEIKLHEQGLESIEVSDNGSGVEECNFQGLTAKYHTSKLREFTDLENVETFGFRGEALSSLCSLSNMTILTRHASSECGTKLELDQFGRIANRLKCARQIGTTVTLKQLFSTLPVRKRDFERNIKKEFNKLCSIVQGYCLIANNVRITCTNVNKKGVKNILMQTNGSDNILDNISCIFGSKQRQDLLELKQLSDDLISDSDIDELLQKDGSGSNELTLSDIRNNLKKFKLNGFISNCTHGLGRSSKDRQFFYINSRPCELKSLIKLVNEIYNRYNNQQHPFVFLNVSVQKSDVDVNITPDKRQVLINNEKLLLSTLKLSLLKTFANVITTFKMENFNNNPMVSGKSSCVSTSPGTVANNSIQENDKLNISNLLVNFRNTKQRDEDEINGIKKRLKVTDNNSKRKLDEILAKAFKMRKIQDYLIKDMKTDDEQTAVVGNVINQSDELNSTFEDTDDIADDNMNPIEKVTLSQEVANNVGLMNLADCSEQVSKHPNNDDNSIPMNKSDNDDDDDDDDADGFEDYDSDEEIETTIDLALQTHCTISMNVSVLISSDEIYNLMNEIKLFDNDSTEESTADQQKKSNQLKFKASIDPTKNSLAEQELQTEIKKENFKQMKIIGQFNLGFIIGQLNDDLFIIDQHATDEKYNFEMLQLTCRLQTQNLVIPQSLDLTAVNEMILIDNLHIFEMNGFKFEINEFAPVTKKIKLIAKPLSQNWEFGKPDIEELLFLLQDSPNTMCRPTRVKSMFASRACRKSVMIGTSLSKSDMRKIVDQMSEIEHPWNCPHGRPTIRHLINLNMIADADNS